jgi:peptidoglycan/LPS O-acetylase OafA/YrhL
VRRVLQLDGLRGMAILMVFLYHSFGVPLLWSGVDLFFVMSGYLITGILLRLKDQRLAGHVLSGSSFWRAFYFRRARRILPPYFLFLVIVGITFQVPWSRVWYWYAFFGADIVTALSQAGVAAMLPLWSLAVEEQFYLMWPFVVRIASTRTLKRVAITVIVATPVLRAACTPLFHSHSPIYALPFFRVDTLAWGALIAVSEFQTPAWVSLHRPLAGLSAVAAGSILAVLSAFHSFRLTANSVSFNALGYTLIGIVFGGIVIYVLGSQDGFVHWLLTKRALRYLGKISYTFYLYHLGVIVLIQRSIHSRGLSGILAFLITSAIAAVSWAVLESPILSSSPRERHLAPGSRPPRPGARAAGLGN